MYEMDAVDDKIVSLLQKNARMSLKDIAAEVYLTSPAVSARIEKLERFGVIQGFHAQINKESLHFQVKAYINLKTDSHRKSELQEFLQSVQNVIQCDSVTGDYSIFMEVVFHNTEELDHFVGKLQTFGETKTQIAFSEIIEHRGLPVSV